MRKNPSLTKPEDLHSHGLLAMSIHDRCKMLGSGFRIGDFSSSRKVRCNNGVFLTDLALDGQGVLVRSIWAVREELRNGKLKQVLADYPIETFGHIYAVIPSKRYLAPRVKVFMDYVIKKSTDLFAD